MIPNRRVFVVGLGAAIFAAAMPAVTHELLPRPKILPKIGLTIPTEWPLTVDYLSRCIKDLYRQVGAMGEANLNSDDRQTIINDIDEALWQIKPAGVQILVETSLENMIDGEFTIEEHGFGTVRIT